AKNVLFSLISVPRPFIFQSTARNIVSGWSVLLSLSGCVQFVTRCLAAFVPVRRLTRVGVQSGVAYASENWTPLRANFLKLGKTEISCHPRSSTRNTMMLGLGRSEEHTSELQSRENLVCRLLLEKKN